MTAALPYLPHELDTHPDRERILATIEEERSAEQEDDSDLHDALNEAEDEANEARSDASSLYRRLSDLSQAIDAAFPSDIPEALKEPHRLACIALDDFSRYE